MKIFEIPYNFDKKLIDNLYQINPSGELYHSIYIAPYFYDYNSAKKYYTHYNNIDMSKQQDISREEYESHINYIKQYNPDKLRLLLQQNNMCISIDLLNYYINLGFKKFCVGNIKQANIIRNILPDSEIIGSITMKIMPNDLLKEKYKVFDGFVLWFPYNRKLSIIKQLPKKYKYILLVNCDCNINCNGTHHWLASSKKEEQNIKCPNHNPILCNWFNQIRINPYDLPIFEPYIAYFKLQGREFTTEYLINDIKKYSKQYSTKFLNPEKYENEKFDFYKKI